MYPYQPGVRAAKKRNRPAHSEPKRCALIIPTVQPEFIIPHSVGSPRFARGTAHEFGSPCSQGEP